MNVDFGCPNEAERARYCDIVAHGFGFPATDAVGWLERVGHENLRVIREGGDVAGCSMRIPMGQFFGGRSVKMVGVSGVGISPHVRGTGVGTRMMHAYELEAKKDGFAISSLYGATHVLYERAGFFRGAIRYAIQVDLRMLQGMTFDLGTTTLSEMPGPAAPELRALYTEVSRPRPGFIDRNDMMWRRVIEPRGLTTKTWVARDRGEVTGYVVLATKQLPTSIDVDVTVTDIVAKTKGATHAILKLLGSYASVAPKVTWQGGPADPFVAILPERHHEIEVAWQSMTQIVNPALAIAQRGFPKHAKGETDLELSRIRVGKTEKSTHRFSLEDGSGVLALTHVAPALAITERGLVALYTGLLSARQLANLGEIASRSDRGSSRGNDAIDFLDDAFAGPTPSLADHF